MFGEFRVSCVWFLELEEEGNWSMNNEQIIEYHTLKTMNMSLREVMDYTRTISIHEGGMVIFMGRMVAEIEKLQKEIKGEKDA
jgi:hypothetical protein